MTTKKKRSRSRSLVRARKKAQAVRPLLEQQQQAQQQEEAHDWHQQVQPFHHHHHYRPATPTRLCRTISCFEVFVQQQDLLDPSELASFWSTLQKPLPTNFRIRSGSDSSVTREWQRLVHNFRLDAWPIDGIAGAWQLQSSSSSSSGEIPAVRSWLARHTKSGAISRQELVSMLPVTLLQIQAHHAVLDLCASPGSKTVQAVDDLYCSDSQSSSSSLPSGFVVANELNARRSHILAHRARQTLGDRHASLAIVCHNATKFPNVQAPLVHCGQQPDGGAMLSSSPSSSYDRIICDVPCSGDGTLRKDTKVWKTWHPSYGIALHQLQIRIAKRGIALLKVGGLMTYSTCSFHPVEDEAVVAALLRTGCVEVVPPDEIMPSSIHWRPGRAYWKVLNDECQEVPSKSDAPSDWPETLWYRPEEDAIHRQLQHSVRLFPQDNDTGGFFIALLRKIKDFANKKNRNPLYPPLLTPVPDHHTLHAVHHEINDDDDITAEPHLLKFRRSKNNTSGGVFALSRSLASHLMDTPGSAKLNIVSAGRKL